MEQSKFYQIKNITEHEYTLVGCDGSVITLPIQEVDKTASAFTIQDAKPGDVLSYRGGQWIFILKEQENNNSIIEYYALLSEDGINIKNAAFTALVLSMVPATKEQRNILFKSMEEAGYRWNQEELKLEKIDKPDIAYINGAISSEDEQGIDKSSCTSTKENNKPETIKFNKERLMEIAKPESIEEKYNIDIDKMVEDFKEQILIRQSLTYDDLLVRAIAYRNGLEDMLKLIKEGGNNEKE